VPRLSSGGRVADFVFVDDIVDGLLHLAANPSITTLDIGTGKLTSVADVARGLRDIINPSGKLGFGSLPDRINETDRVADVKRTAALTGWRPRYELAEGLHRTVDWYREHLPALGWME
jgi:UDP-glucose 4-epimerase